MGTLSWTEMGAAAQLYNTPCIQITQLLFEKRQEREMARSRNDSKEQNFHY